MKALATWLALIAAAILVEPVIAQPSTQPEPEKEDEPVPAPEVETSEDLPDYSGDWRSRRYLTGDWGGRRSDLAAKGVTFDLGWTQVFQGVVDGGRRQDWDYGGNLDLTVNADFGRLKLIPGGSMSVVLESRYGETVNDDSGSFSAVNTRGLFPLTDGVDEDIPLAIAQLAYTQNLFDTLDLSIGKFIMVEGDPTEFAGGDGSTQFLNSNFVYNAVTSQTSPYSTLGVALDWYPTSQVTFSSALYATTDSSTTTGFDQLDEGLTWWTQVAGQYRLGDLPGGLDVGVQYAFDNEFTLIGGKLALIPGTTSLAAVSDSWAVFCGGWQYLYTPDTPPDEVDASDGRADLRGIGVFGRLGLADPDTNPINWSGSIGLGGRGLLPGRDHDSFGAGYFYTDVQNSRAFSALGLASSGQGLEAYYSLAVTGAVFLTADVQWVDGGLAGVDAATVVGFRLHMEF